MVSGSVPVWGSGLNEAQADGPDLARLRGILKTPGVPGTQFAQGVESKAQAMA